MHLTERSAGDATPAQFTIDGVATVRGVLDSEQLWNLAQAVEENMADPGPWADDDTPSAAADHGDELVPDIEAERHRHRIVRFALEPGAG